MQVQLLQEKSGNEDQREMEREGTRGRAWSEFLEAATYFDVPNQFCLPLSVIQYNGLLIFTVYSPPSKKPNPS